jgi:TonB-dependent receptor
MSVNIPGFRKVLHAIIVFIFCFLCFVSGGFSQSSPGYLKGSITDGASFKPLFDVAIELDTVKVNSYADGSYFIKIKPGRYTLYYSLEGFGPRSITGVEIRPGQLTNLDIILEPVATSDLLVNSFDKEIRHFSYNVIRHSNNVYDIIDHASVQPGNDKNGALLLKRLNGVITDNNPGRPYEQSLNLFGFGERYNQVLLNGAILPSAAPSHKAFLFELIPTEIIERVQVQKTGNASIPGNFAGGNLEIQTKDFTLNDFIYLQVGASFSKDIPGNSFFSDKRGKWEFLGFGNKQRNLPGDFPSIRSLSTLNQKNPQEQASLSAQLPNDLGPIDYKSSVPGNRILVGYGKNIRLKQGPVIGIIAFLNHQRSEQIDQATIQVAPNTINNPYPYLDNSKAVINSQSEDINYRYASGISGTVNASILFGRNKVALKTFAGSLLSNTYTQRSSIFKPGEDTLAHTGVHYQFEQTKFINGQLSGIHALGKDGSFKLEWQASYLYSRQHIPDERNLLLRESAAGTFEIARASTASQNSIDQSFTNSGRSWKDYTDHNFNGSVNLLVPFNVFGKNQVLSGGLNIQTKYRIFYSDLYLVQGPGFFSLNELLAPFRYFPGGLSVRNYYVRPANLNLLNYSNRGNYTASTNYGAGYLMLESKIADGLSFNGGIRMESGTQLVSNMQYNYFPGFRNPRIIPIDQNTKVSRVEVLPSATLKYDLSNAIRLHGAYFKTLNRPELEELASNRFYDALAFEVRTGNPLLEISTIDNFDAGARWFINAGSDISVSGFYKKFFQPIEYVQSSYGGSQDIVLSTPHNAPSAESKGLTASARIRLDLISQHSWLSSVSLFASGTLLESKVKAGPIKSLLTPMVASHSLSQNPDQTMNAGIVIQDPRFPCITLSYSHSSDYLSAIGSGPLVKLSNGNSISAVPDYRVKGRDQMDVQLSQKFFRSKLQVIAGINGLLEDDYIRYQDLNGNKKFDEALLLGTNAQGKGGFFQSGIDNTIMKITSRRTYYFTISYLFK